MTNKDYDPIEIKEIINDMVDSYIKNKATCGEDIQKINKLRNEANCKLDKEILEDDHLQ